MVLRRICECHTDFHSVDEDMRTLSMQSGDWSDVYGAGIAYRTMSNDKNTYYDFVASHVSTSQDTYFIRISTMSTRMEIMRLFTVVVT